MPAVRPDRPSRPSDRPLVGDPRRLEGIDMRTKAGLRYREIVEALVAEFGSANKIALRELAGHRFALEQTQALIVAGDVRARTDAVRLANLVARKTREMRESVHSIAAKQLPATLEQHLARKRLQASLREAELDLGLAGAHARHERHHSARNHRRSH